MIPISGTFLPAPPSQEYIVALVRAQYQIWREEKEVREPKWIAENVRFAHDPHWRDHFLSTQCAHDCNHWVWRYVRILYLTGATAPYFIQMVH